MPISDLTALGYLKQHEPQRQNNVVLHIVNPPAPAGVPSSGTADDVLVLALESFPIPKRSINPIEIGHFNGRVKYAGRPTYDPLQIVYKDLVTAETYLILAEWWKAVHRDTDFGDGATPGRIGFKWRADGTGYARNGYVLLYPPTGDDGAGGDTLTRQWNIEGMWPSTFDPGEADMNGEDYIRVNVTFECDRVYPVDIRTSGPTAPEDFQG